jgi:hypothetical protein
MNTGIIIGIIIVIIIIAVFVLKPTPIDCKVSDWTNSGVCNSATGKQPQVRTITQQASNGGAACPNLTQEVDCKVDCKVGEWTNSGVCNTATGKQQQVRTVITQPKNGGAVCPSLTQDVDCKVDCEYEPWTLTEICNPLTVKKYEMRNIKYQAKNGGILCNTDSDSSLRRQDSTIPCNPVNCEYYPTEGPNAVFDIDSSSCQVDGSGTVIYKQKIKTPAQYGGTCPPALQVKTESCPGADANCEFTSPVVEVKNQITNAAGQLVDQVDVNTGRCYVTKRVEKPAGVNGTCVNTPYISSTMQCEQPIDCEYGNWEYIPDSDNTTSGFIGRYGSIYDSHIN